MNTAFLEAMARLIRGLFLLSSHFMPHMIMGAYEALIMRIFGTGEGA